MNDEARPPGSTDYPDRPFAAMSLTSWYAARSLTDQRLSDLKRQIIAELHRHPGGLNDDELGANLGQYRYSVAPRRRWLYKARVVVDTGTRRKGVRPESKLQTVWGLAIEGTFVKPPPKAKLPPGKIAYPQALALIDALHRPDEKNVAFCAECRRPVPCSTALILERARLRERPAA
jgi:hypothetical protein